MVTHTNPMPKKRVFWTKGGQYWTQICQFLYEGKNSPKSGKMVENLLKPFSENLISKFLTCQK